MVNKNPKVSVIIPAYNSANTISTCVEGVLAQNYRNLEVIVVNDCSTDATASAASKFSGVKVISTPKNKGPSYARNLGIKRSRGDFVILLDSDAYVVDKNWIKKHINAQLKNKNSIIGGGIVGQGKGIMGRAGKYLWATNIPNSGSKNPRGYAHLVTNNLSFSRRIFDKIGGFDEGVRSGEDVIFCHEATKLGFTLLLQSNILVFHNDNGKLGEAIRKSFVYGKDRIAVKKKGAYKYGFLLPYNPYLCFLFSPFISFLCMARVIVNWWPWDKRVLAYSPVIFLSNFLMALGAASEALKSGKTTFKK